MKIKKLEVEKLYGMINYNLNFKSNMNYLTGINGSGKTTILKLIEDITTVDLKKLNRTEFSKLIMQIDDDGKEVELVITKVEDFLVLETSIHDAPFFISSEKIKTAINNDNYIELLFTLGNNEVFAYYEGLEKPFYIPLDRRRRELEYGMRTKEKMFRDKRIKRLSLDDRSLSDIMSLVANAYRAKQSHLNLLNEKLRKKIMLSSFQYIGSRKFSQKVWTLKELRRKRKIIEKTLDSLKIIENQVELSDIMSYFDKLENVISNIGGIKIDENKLLENENYIEWVVNLQQIERIDYLMQMIEEHNNETDNLFETVNSFQIAISEYFEDTNKKIEFDSTGEMYFKHFEKEITIEKLSSGERQILIILAHLYFANSNEGLIYMIDEPELSLHLMWQKRFAKSLLRADPKSQYFLATHAPEIVSGDNANLVKIKQERSN